MTGAVVSDSELERIRLLLVDLVDLGAGGGVTVHADLTGLSADDHPQYQLRTEKAQANGYAGLGAGGLVPTAQLGTGSANSTKYLAGDGSWQTTPIVISAHSGLSGLSANDHPQYQLVTGKGVASGYAGLDSGALVPVAQLGTGVSVTTKYLRGDQTWQTLPAQDFAYASLTGAPDLTIYPLLDGTRPYTGNLRAPTLSVGGAPLTGPLLSIPVAPTASANYGLISLGSGPFDGATSGFYVGNSNGTHIAINAASGYTGRMADWQVGGVRMFGVGRPTQASSASATLNAIDLPSFTVTVTGSTNITTAAGFNYTRMGAPVYSAASALAITNAATLAIEGAPSGAGAGPATITNPYALWVQAGATRLDGRVISTVNGAASAPGLLLSGTPFAGTGTTSFPQLYINDSTATASTTFSTAGSYFGVNGHGSADLINLMVDGVSKLRMISSGFIGLGLGSTSPSDYLHIFNAGAGAGGLTISSTAGIPLIALSADTSSKYAGLEFRDGATAYGGMLLDRSSSIITGTSRNDVVVFSNSTSALHFATNSTIRATFSASGASVRLGKSNNASPQGFTITIGESSRAGTDSNIAGASGTIQPGTGTGTGTTVPLILNAPIQVASGTGAQTQTEFMRGQAVGTSIGLSFYGVAAVARQLLATGAGATVDNVITALQNLGLVRQS